MTSIWTKAKCGQPHNGTDDNNSQKTHFYLENTDSTLVLGSESGKMSCKAHMLWRTLNGEGMATNFGQISGKAWEYFSQMLLVDKIHKFLLLCNN